LLPVVTRNGVHPFSISTIFLGFSSFIYLSFIIICTRFWLVVCFLSEYLIHTISVVDAMLSLVIHTISLFAT
jgi:hypothetical protein